MNFHNVEFLISAASTKDFPANRLPEIAFAGKSNVGKSSVINRVLNRKNFARVGEKPGKSKTDKADKLGIPRMSEVEFLEMVKN